MVLTRFILQQIPVFIDSACLAGALVRCRGQAGDVSLRYIVHGPWYTTQEEHSLLNDTYIVL